MADTTPVETRKLPTLAVANQGSTGEVATYLNSATFGNIASDMSFGLMSIMPNPDPVLRKAGLFESALDDLASDPHIFSLIQIRKAGVLSKEWDIDRGKAKSGFAEMIHALFSTYNMPNLITQILDAELYGNQPLEVTWLSNSNSWLPAMVEAKPRGWFSFGFDGTLRFHSKDHPTDGIVVRRFRGQPEPYEIRYKFLCPRNSPTYMNPYGEAVLSRCYWNQFFKKQGKKFWAQFIENFGAPWVSGEYLADTGEDKVNEFLATLQAMAGGRTIAVPEGTGVQFHSPPAGVSDTFEKFLDDARAEIAWAILGHSSMNKNTAGKLGNDTTELTVAEWVMSSGKIMVEHTMNELISWIAELNGIQGERPRFILFEEEDVDMDQAQRDEVLSKIGVKFTPPYIQKTYSLDATDFTIEAPKPAAPALFSSDPAAEGQQHIDDYLGKVLEDTGATNDAVSAMFSAVESFMNDAATFEEAKGKIAKVLPKMDTGSIEEIMFRIIAAGRFTGYSAASAEGK